MKASKRPFRSDRNAEFPDARCIGGFEGGAIYQSAKAGKHYLIIDEGTLADFLSDEDQDLLDHLVTVFEFDTEHELNEYLNKTYRFTGFNNGEI